METIDQITIIGTGLLGTSLGLAVKKHRLAHRVVGLGRTQATLDLAVARGGIDVACLDWSQALDDARLAVIALPLGCFDDAFKQIAQHQEPGLIITDVGSTKQSVIDTAAENLRSPRRFVGSHPMAGSEQAGPNAADVDLFEGKPCIVTPQPNTDPCALACVEELWSALGMRVLRMSPAEHDRQVAAVSHLPHVTAGLLVELAHELGGLDIASTGFASTTRLAAGSASIWADILCANREPMVHALRRLSDRAADLAELVGSSDHDALYRWLNEQQIRRDNWTDHTAG